MAIGDTKKQKDSGLEHIVGLAEVADPEVEQLQRKLTRQYDHEFALCGADFWYWLENVITEDEDHGELRPFPTHFEYLRELDWEIENNQKVIALKSRRLLASWLGMLRQLHCGMFAGTGVAGVGDVYRGGVMTVGEVEAIYLMERINRVYHRLPEWMKRRNRLETDNQLILRFNRGGTIQAFPMKREGPQTFGFTRVFFDEMALQEAARTTWTGMIPTLGARGKLLAVSTPNGRANFFYDVWSNRNGLYKGVYRRKIHWTENPEHDHAWYVAATAGMDKQMIARMFELSFAVYAGAPVYPEFDVVTHVIELEKIQIITSKPALVGWDFGYHYPAASLWQFTQNDILQGFHEIQGYDRGFDQFCAEVKLYFASKIDIKRQPLIHFVDPAGRQPYRTRAKSGAVNDVGEIKQQWGGPSTQVYFGAMEVGRRASEGPRLKEVRRLLRLRADGNPGMRISDDMELTKEGFMGGYCYPDRQRDSEEPEKNESSHLQDTNQYVTTGAVKLFQPGREDREETTAGRRRPRPGRGRLHNYH